MNIEVLMVYLSWGKAVTQVRAYCEHIYFLHVKIFVNLRKLAISRGLKFAYLFLLLVCGIIKVIFNLYIFSRIFDKREKLENMNSANVSTFTVVMDIVHYMYLKIAYIMNLAWYI